MNRRARQDENVAEARVTAGKLHTHIMTCCLLKQTEDAFTELLGVFKRVETLSEGCSTAPAEVSQAIQ